MVLRGGDLEMKLLLVFGLNLLKSSPNDKMFTLFKAYSNQLTNLQIMNLLFLGNLFNLT